MKRRTFIKGLTVLISLGYINPVSLLPEVKDAYITISEADAYYETSLALNLGCNEFRSQILLPAAKKLSDKADECMAKLIMGEEL